MKITVKFVNEKGSILTTDGKWYGKVKGAVLPDFEVGKTYDVEIASREWQGKTYYNIAASTGSNEAASLPVTKSASKAVNKSSKVNKSTDYDEDYDNKVGFRGILQAVLASPSVAQAHSAEDLSTTLEAIKRIALDMHEWASTKPWKK